ncbi:hypothetical protein AB1Y20_011554 [Prymnesium parvum]|uniref:Secreted protein n=1 Tax=Prymnesium parvum TaxID=97485 RepID=A0AB34IJD7_PRYPA
MKSVKPRVLRGAFDGTPRLHALHFLLLICMTDPSVPLVRPVSCGRFPWRQLRGLVLRTLVRHVAVIVGHPPSLAALLGPLGGGVRSAHCLRGS